MKKFLKWFGISFGIISIIGLICIEAIWENQIISLSNLKQINNEDKNYPFYTMTYKGDYGFDDYLKVGSKNLDDYIEIALNETTHGMGDIVMRESPNCASFTAIAPNGDRLFARNLDTDEAIPLYLTTNPSNGYKSMSMTNLMLLEYDKNNLNQIFQAKILNIVGAPATGSEPTVKENKVTLNEYSLMRMVLDKATTVEEAVKMIKSYNMSFLTPEYPCHFMIADATGASVVVEYVDGELQTVYNDKPYQIVTNFILYNNPSGGFGFDRYQRIESQLKKTEGILTEKEAIKLLSENTIKGDEQWSVVYNLTQKKAFICVGKDYETIYEFELD